MTERPGGRPDPARSPDSAMAAVGHSAEYPRRRRLHVSQQTLTAIISSLVFLALALVLALVPVPYVGWGPGSTVNVAGANSEGHPVLAVNGLPTTPLNGELRLTTVSQTRVDSQLGLMEAAFNYWMPHRDVLPRNVIYPPGKSTAQVKAEEVAMMTNSQADAVVAALRAAGQPVTELPMVTGVTLSGPALNRLKPGDMITKVDAKAVQTVNDVATVIQAHRVGEPVVFTVERSGKPESVTVTTVAAPNNPQQPHVGIRLGVGYKYSPTVSYGIDPDIVGPSAGIVFALGIYDLVTPEDLLEGRRVAGTGEITPEGTVQAIGGVQEKVRGAEKAGAQIFLVPEANCKDLAGMETDMEVVAVGTLREAIGGLQKLKSSKDGTGVPRC